MQRDEASLYGGQIKSKHIVYGCNENEFQYMYGKQQAK